MALRDGSSYRDKNGEIFTLRITETGYVCVYRNRVEAFSRLQGR